MKGLILTIFLAFCVNYGENLDQENNKIGNLIDVFSFNPYKSIHLIINQTFINETFKNPSVAKRKIIPVSISGLEESNSNFVLNKILDFMYQNVSFVVLVCFYVCLKNFESF